jgi:hypothetical protein
MKEKDENVESDQKGEVVLLEDLAPRKDVKAGCGGILFGEAFLSAAETDAGLDRSADASGLPGRRRQGQGRRTNP